RFVASSTFVVEVPIAWFFSSPPRCSFRLPFPTGGAHHRPCRCVHAGHVPSWVVLVCWNALGNAGVSFSVHIAGRWPRPRAVSRAHSDIPTFNVHPVYEHLQ